MGVYHGFEKNEAATMFFLKKPSLVICFIIPLCYSKKKNDYFNWKRISSSMGMITKNTCLFKNNNSESVY